MPDSTQRPHDVALTTLAVLIEHMERLGMEAEDRAARLTTALRATFGPDVAPNEPLATAVSDVIEIMAERSRVAHEVYRVIQDLQTGRADRRRIPRFTMLQASHELVPDRRRYRRRASDRV